MKRFEGSAMPMLLVGPEEYASTNMDNLDRPAAALASPNALGDVDRLAVGVGVPGRPRARREMDVARRQARSSRRRRDCVDETVPDMVLCGSFRRMHWLHLARRLRKLWMRPLQHATYSRVVGQAVTGILQRNMAQATSSVLDQRQM
jgi:hypothetical protein